jgi:hypothetical protein
MKGLPTEIYGFSGILEFETVGFRSNAPLSTY